MFASGRRSFGHSLVVDPWGHVLTPTLFTALREDPETDWSTAEGAALYQLHKSRIEEVRSRMPVQVKQTPLFSYTPLLPLQLPYLRAGP